jgi:hypothetical protein
MAINLSSSKRAHENSTFAAAYLSRRRQHHKRNQQNEQSGKQFHLCCSLSLVLYVLVAPP